MTLEGHQKIISYRKRAKKRNLVCMCLVFALSSRVYLWIYHQRGDHFHLYQWIKWLVNTEGLNTRDSTGCRNARLFSLSSRHPRTLQKLSPHKCCYLFVCLCPPPLLRFNNSTSDALFDIGSFLRLTTV